MSAQAPSGHVGNLTPDQEDKVRKIWHSIFQLCGVVDDNVASTPTAAAAEATTADTKPSAAEHETPKKKRFTMFRKKDSEHKAGAPSPSGSDAPTKDDDKYGQTKQFHETLASQSPESIHKTIWDMVKHDHPDALVLRFLRARKWDVEKALIMLVSTMNWRHAEMHVDDDIIKNGEGGAVHDEKNGDATAKKIGHDFMAQIRMGKSFLHGVDKEGRPICVVRVRLHRQGEQCEESLERYTVYLIETARMALTPPVDTANIVFDMTGFSLANMDYTPVKFMIKCFEANYPESLGAVLVHNAPWVFQGIWRIIRGWLDPVVAAKVHFTNNVTDLQEFIEPSRIIKELGGSDGWEYKFEEPIAGENDLMNDTETRDQLVAGRNELIKQFEQETLQWIRNPDAEGVQAVKDQRQNIAGQLKEDYWKIDPYLRARTLYDRQGIIKAGGKVDWYLNDIKEAGGRTTATNGTLGVEASANDVD